MRGRREAAGAEEQLEGRQWSGDMVALRNTSAAGEDSVFG